MWGVFGVAVSEEGAFSWGEGEEEAWLPRIDKQTRTPLARTLKSAATRAITQRHTLDAVASRRPLALNARCHTSSEWPLSTAATCVGRFSTPAS